MPPTWFRAEAEGRRPEAPVELPYATLDEETDAAGYRPDPGLTDAVNVALHLGQPLLLTGQPGTGKTQLAKNLAWQLGFAPPLKFETKSTSVARDLFYTYDALSRFHAAQSGQGSVDAIGYIHFTALGLAILRAKEPDAVRHLLPAKELHSKKCRSVVLIDEIDKAPRDFPNDLLNEIEGMYFKIPELEDLVVEADPALRPIVVLTSNSEKNLAEAFLRRCVFYDIPFPEKESLKRIVHSRLGERVSADRVMVEDAFEIFDKLRDKKAGLLKPPSTAEFLAWLRVLDDGSPAGSLRQRGQALVEPALSCLIKTMEDRPKARDLLNAWLGPKQP